jgi:hypothetical protein
LNSLFNTIGSALFAVLGWLPAVAVIAVLAVLTAAGSLVVFKWTSNQEKIRAAKAPMKGHLLGILLFRHDLRMLFASLGGALGRSLANLRFLALPLAVMIVPLFLLFVQFEMHLGSRGLAVGEASVLRVHVADGADLDSVRLVPPDGVAVETPGVRVSDPSAGLREVDWRIRAKADGEHELTVEAGDERVAKSVTVGSGPALVSHLRAKGFFDALLYPTEPALPAAGTIDRVELGYEPVTYAFLGIDWAWWVLFLVVMILALFALRGPLGVDF